MTALPPMSPWQSVIWDHANDNWMLLGGRRKGKSWTCSRKGVHYAVNARFVAWYCASRLLADENWDEVVEFASPFATRVNRNNLGIMEFDNPDLGRGIFRRKSGWGDSAGRAGTLDFAIIDEAQLVKQKLFNRILPSLATRRGLMALTLTAPETPAEFRNAQWLKNVLDSIKGEEGMATLPGWTNWYVTKSPTKPEDIAFYMQHYERSFGILDRAWDYYLKVAADDLDNTRYVMGEDDYQREYNLRWYLDVNTLVYNNLTDGVHRSNEFDFNKDYPVRWAIDRGEGNAYTVLGMFQRKPAGTLKLTEAVGGIIVTREITVYRYDFFNEVYSKQMIDEDEMISEGVMLSEKEHYPAPEWVFYDPRAPRYRKAIINAGLRPYTFSLNVEDGIRTLRRIANRNQLGIHPRCDLLWRQGTSTIDGYRRDEKGEPVDENNDAWDMARYGITLSERLAGNTNSVSEENRSAVSTLGGSNSEALLLPI